MTPLELAEEYGLPVFPCNPKKEPLTPHGFKDATNNIEVIDNWWREFPGALVGVPTGPDSKLLVVDVDPEGEAWFAENAERFACGYIQSTRRGRHLYYTHPEGKFGCSTSKLARGVDVRASGGYVIQWGAAGLPGVGSLLDIGPPPAWLVEELRRVERKEKSKGSGTGQPGDGHIREPGRNDALSALAFEIRRKGLDVAEIEAALLVANQRRCDPPLPDDEVRKIAYGKGKVEPDADELRGKWNGQTHVMFRPIHEIIATPTHVDWLLRGILERRVITLVAGRRGTFKSFLVLHWALTLARLGVPVFIVSAEGAGLGRRVEAWLAIHAPGVDPKTLPLYVHEQRINLNDPLALAKVRAAVVDSGLAPELLVIDTFSKNSGGLDENSNSEVKAFIGGLDTGLRVPLDVSLVLVAHTGHGDQTRVRGASALEADTDAALIVNRPGVERIVTVERNRFKDAPELPPLVYQAEEVDLGRLDDEGQRVTSLVMREADEQTRATVQRKAPTGKAQKAILRALRNRQGESKGACIWTLEDMRKIGRELGQHKQTARDAVDGLVCNGFLTPTVGGHRLADQAA